MRPRSSRATTARTTPPPGGVLAVHNRIPATVSAPDVAEPPAATVADVDAGPCGEAAATAPRGELSAALRAKLTRLEPELVAVATGGAGPASPRFAAAVAGLVALLQRASADGLPALGAACRRRRHALPVAGGGGAAGAPNAGAGGNAPATGDAKGADAGTQRPGMDAFELLQLATERLVSPDAAKAEAKAFLSWLVLPPVRALARPAPRPGRSRPRPRPRTLRP